MINNQVVQVIKTFSKKEMTRFCEFVESPYFNKHRAVRRLVGYFSDLFPKFTLRNCHREQVFKQVFPGAKYQQSELALVFTYTTKLLEKFLAQEQFKEYPHFDRILLLRKLRSKKQDRFYEKANHKFDQELNRSIYKDSEHFNIQFLKAAESDTYYTERSKHEKDLSLQLKQNNLDNYYLAVKLRDACEMLVRSKVLKIEYSTGLLIALVETVQENLSSYAHNPSVIVYFSIYQMIHKNENAAYFRALEVTRNQSHYFTIPELQNIYNYLQNYCIEQINKGDRSFLEASFDLFKEQLDQSLLVDENGFLFEGHYKNIVTAGIRLKEMDWTHDFIEKHRHALRPELQSNAYTFNLASYYYATQQLEKVLDLLVQVEYTDIRYSLGAKSLLLRTYYDLNADEALRSLTRSFSQYLSRNKLIPEQRKRAMSNLVRFTNRAFQIKSNLEYTSKTKSARELFRLKAEIQEAEVINRDWLNARLGEIG